MARENRYDGILVEPQGSMDALPLELKIRTSGKAVFLSLVMSGLLALLAYNAEQIIPFHLFGEYRAMAEQFLPLAIAVLAALFAIRALFRKFALSLVRITSDRVSMATRTPIGTRGWSEPLAAFQGVRWKRFLVTSRNDNSRQTQRRYRNVIELQHANPKHTFALMVYTTGRADAAATLALARTAFATRDPSDEQKAEMEAAAEDLARQSRGDHLRQRWEQMAALLNLPAIDARDGGETIRQVEDLDKTVRELAEEGRKVTDWKQGSPPEPLAIESESDGTEAVVIRQTDAPLVARLFMILGAIMVVLGLFTLQFGLAFGGILFAGAGFFIQFIGKANPRRLQIVDGELRYINPNRRHTNFKVPLARIEGIEIRDREADQAYARTLKIRGQHLWILSDRGEFTAGGGLSSDALIWLRGYLLHAAKNH